MQVSKSFQINVIDVNEAPFNLMVTSKNMNTKFPVNQPMILENADKNNLIGQIEVQDYDTNDVVSMRSTSMKISLVNQQCIPSGKVRKIQLLKILDLQFISYTIPRTFSNAY